MRESERSEAETWVERHGDALFAYALTRVSDPQTAEDVVQETFLAALKAREQFAGQSSERTWLLAILKRRIVDHYRQWARRVAQAADECAASFNEPFTSAGSWQRAPSDWGVDPVRAMERREFQEVLHRCLAALPPRMQAAMVLRELEGLPSEEVCQILGVSPTNLWTLLHRARLRLRACLEQNWFGKES
jgi:RNA polymerase sigma-70 factor (ECF subfamily)